LRSKGDNAQTKNENSTSTRASTRVDTKPPHNIHKYFHL